MNGSSTAATYLVGFEKDTRFVIAETIVQMSALVQVNFEAARDYWIGMSSSVVAISVVYSVA